VKVAKRKKRKKRRQATEIHLEERAREWEKLFSVENKGVFK
jgi:hypothetical protein